MLQVPDTVVKEGTLASLVLKLTSLSVAFCYLQQLEGTAGNNLQLLNVDDQRWWQCSSHPESLRGKFQTE
jgi:hypothetical protein